MVHLFRPNSPASCAVIRYVKTFDAKKLSPEDFITVPSTAPLRLKLPIPGDGYSNHIDFRKGHSQLTRPGLRLRGFLYYHVAHPRHFLSGGLRFRWCDNADSFERGIDLPDHARLPWEVSLPAIFTTLPRLGSFLRQLVQDDLLTSEQVKVGRKLLGGIQIPAVLVHRIGQPFVMDFSAKTSVRVVGPHSILHAFLHPRVAHSGSAIVHFERAPHPGELHLRVNRLLSEIIYLPELTHRPPITSGNLLPALNGNKPWGWTYDIGGASSAAALHCLFNPTYHFLPPGYVSKADEA